MRFYSKKIIRLHNADCHLHYANNRERGTDNVTLTFVPRGTERPPYTALYDKTTILKQYRVSGWRGHVNVPTGDIEKFGGLRSPE